MHGVQFCEEFDEKDDKQQQSRRQAKLSNVFREDVQLGLERRCLALVLERHHRPAIARVHTNSSHNEYPDAFRYFGTRNNERILFGQILILLNRAKDVVATNLV